MCEVCGGRSLSRRSMLSWLGAGVLAGGYLIAGGAAKAAGDPGTSMTADEAFAKLKAGNDKYVQSPQLCAADLANARNATTGSQTPWATIVSCSDSRVPPELLFGGLGIGDLFINRTAGNTADGSASMGTIEYGAAVLGTPLIVVLGHEKCGAAIAACDIVTKKATFPGAIGPMVRPIVPAAEAAKGRPGDFIENTVRENARRTAARISRSKLVADRVKDGKVKVVAGYYALATGKVEYLS